MRSTRPIDPPHEPHGQASVNQGVHIATEDADYFMPNESIATEYVSATSMERVLLQRVPCARYMPLSAQAYRLLHGGAPALDRIKVCVCVSRAGSLYVR
jgi:hypothetical protein